eukprot:6531439-Alexandrium_andersonii.AAC.1
MMPSPGASGRAGAMTRAEICSPGSAKSGFRRGSCAANSGPTSLGPRQGGRWRRPGGRVGLVAGGAECCGTQDRVAKW